MAGRFLAQIPQVLGTVFRNPELRRVELAFAGFNAAEWAVWIAMLVYAYHQGGATTAGLVALVQLVPAGLAAPFASVLADRRGAPRILVLGYVAQSLAMGATAVALLTGAPPIAAYLLAAAAATAVTLTRPTQATLLPALARAPEELTAANVVSGWIESVSVLVAPAVAGVLLGVSGPGVVFAVMAGVAGASAVLVAPLAGRRVEAAREEAPGALSEMLAAFRLLAHEPYSRVLVALLGAQFIAIGALDVLYVVLSIDVLGLGDSGAGYLNAAFGAGGAIGIAATASLVGRRRLVPALVIGTLAWSAALAVLGLLEAAAGAFLLLAIAGAGRIVLDVAGRTLLQRTAPTDVLARVFGIVEGLTMAGLAAGSLLASALVALGGAKAGLLGVAAVMPILLVLTGHRLLRADARATVPVVEIALLRSMPIFAPLPAPTLEGLAKSLDTIDLPANEVFIRQGDRGDRFYIVCDGRLEVEVDGERVAERGRGEGVGEIALLRDVPRTATVRTLAPTRLYALEREPFVAAVTGHDPTARAADRVIEEREVAPGAA